MFCRIHGQRTLNEGEDPQWSAWASPTQLKVKEGKCVSLRRKKPLAPWHWLLPAHKHILVSLYLHMYHLLQASYGASWLGEIHRSLRWKLMQTHVATLQIENKDF